ncbi:MAG: hypothetical protein EOM46_05095 [Gammaproteobacteria bacterium]|nr:hypothetical protein [Gammaproteobacteria bacterium]
MAGVKSTAPYIATEYTNDNVVVQIDTSIDAKILKLMAKPITSFEIQKTLKASQQEFTISFNRLIKSGKIKRQENSKKQWLSV